MRTVKTLAIIIKHGLSIKVWTLWYQALFRCSINKIALWICVGVDDGTPE